MRVEHKELMADPASVVRVEVKDGVAVVLKGEKRNRMFLASDGQWRKCGTFAPRHELDGYHPVK